MSSTNSSATSSANKPTVKRKYNRDSEILARDFITGLYLCHTVTSYFENQKKIF
jgi:hypothetical protein